MGWVKLDDGFWLSEKMDAVSDKAFRLYVRALSYSGQNKTNGLISNGALRRLESTHKVAEELAAAGLWETDPGGWQIHDYLEWQTPRANLSEAGKRGAAKRWSNDQGYSPPHGQGHSQGYSPPHKQGLMATPIAEAYSRPNPTKTLPEEDPTKTPPNSAPGRTPEDGEPLALDFGATFDEAKAWMGHALSKTEMERVSSAIADYGEERVRFAIQTARDAGNTGLNYMLTVCRNNQNPEQPNANRTRNGTSTGGYRSPYRLSAAEVERNTQLWEQLKANGKVISD